MSAETEGYVAQRGHYGAEYASTLTRFVEEWNCSKGCTRPSPESIAEFGPGGSCDLLANLFTQTPTPEFDPQDDRIVCLARTPCSCGKPFPEDGGAEGVCECCSGCAS